MSTILKWTTPCIKSYRISLWILKSGEYHSSLWRGRSKSYNQLVSKLARDHALRWARRGAMGPHRSPTTVLFSPCQLAGNSQTSSKQSSGRQYHSSLFFWSTECPLSIWSFIGSEFPRIWISFGHWLCCFTSFSTALFARNGTLYKLILHIVSRSLPHAFKAP